jgi:hypothetical protein
MSDLSPEELDYLDRLWDHQSLTLREIWSRMRQKFGVQYTQEQLRAAAKRNDVAVTRTPVPIVLTKPRPRVWKPTQSRDTQCRQPVPPGSFSYGPKGYRMGQASG